MLRAAGIAAALLGLAGCAAAPTGPGPGGAGVSVAGDRCPSSIAGSRGVRSPAADRAALLPGALRPTGAVVCEYASVVARGRDVGRLQHRLVLDRAGARALADTARAVRIVAVHGAVSCPADVGTTTLIGFLPEVHGSDVALRWATSGCQSLGDGVVATTQLANPSFGRFQAVFARVASGRDGGGG